jgi:hypothetical protein
MDLPLQESGDPAERKSRGDTMGVGATSALSLYNFQGSVATYGQGSAPAAQGDPAPSSSGGLPGPDEASSPARSSLDTLAGGALSKSLAGGQTAPNLRGLSASAASVGGMSAATASILLAGGSGNGLDTLSSSDPNLNATLALASYSNAQNDNPNGTLLDGSILAANAQGGSQAAQAASLNSTLNLFA